MKTTIDQTQEEQNTAAPKVQQEPNTGGTATIVDNRPATVYQRKLRKTIDASTGNGPTPIQLFHKTSNGGTATIVDNRPSTLYQRKLRAAMNAPTDNNNTSPVQRASSEPGKKGNKIGLPDTLKSGIENLSGHNMDDVKVHYNSSKPAQLQAHAYAQGTDIHLAPGQEKHLPHEAWHVVQQKQGRVKPTMQLKGKGVNINDDAGLEKEADVMGAKALQAQTQERQSAEQSGSSTATSLLSSQPLTSAIQTKPVIQRLMSVSKWKSRTSITSVTRKITSRSGVLKSIDTAIDQYHKVPEEDLDGKIAALHELKEKIVLFRRSRSGETSKNDDAVNDLYLEVLKELSMQNAPLVEDDREDDYEQMFTLSFEDWDDSISEKRQKQQPSQIANEILDELKKQPNKRYLSMENDIDESTLADDLRSGREGRYTIKKTKREEGGYAYNISPGEQHKSQVEQEDGDKLNGTDHLDTEISEKVEIGGKKFMVGTASMNGYNCLIYSIAQALGVACNSKEAQRIRKALLKIQRQKIAKKDMKNPLFTEDSFLPNDQFVLRAIISELGEDPDKVSIVFFKDENLSEEDHLTYGNEGAEKKIYIRHVNRNHFEPCYLIKEGEGGHEPIFTPPSIRGSDNPRPLPKPGKEPLSQIANEILDELKKQPNKRYLLMENDIDESTLADDLRSGREGRYTIKKTKREGGGYAYDISPGEQHKTAGKSRVEKRGGDSEFNYIDHPGKKAREEVINAILQWTSLIGQRTETLEAETAACNDTIDQHIDYLEAFIKAAKEVISPSKKYKEKLQKELFLAVEGHPALVGQPNYIRKKKKELQKREKKLQKSDKEERKRPEYVKSRAISDLTSLPGRMIKRNFPESEYTHNIEGIEGKIENAKEDAEKHLGILKQVKKNFASLVGEEQNLQYAYHKSFWEYFKKLRNGEIVEKEELQEVVRNKSEAIDAIKAKIISYLENLALDLEYGDIKVKDKTLNSLVDVVIKNAAQEVLGKHLAGVDVENQCLHNFASGEIKKDGQTITGIFNFSQGVGALLKLLQKALGLTTVYNVTSADLGIKISLGATADLLAKFLEIGGSIFVALKGSINIQDDRRLRAGGSLTLGATAKASALWRFIKTKSTISKEIGIGGTFDDLKHFVAWIMQKLYEIKMSLKSVLLREKAGDLTDEEQAELRSKENDGIDWAALKSKKPVTVTSNTNTLEIGGSAGWGILEGSGNKTSKKTTFYKETEPGVVVVKKGTTMAKSTSLSLEIPKIGKFSGQYTETEVKNDANPDNDGKYRNIKIGLPNLPFSELTLASFRDKAADIENFYGKEENSIEKLKTIFHYLKDKYSEEHKDPEQDRLSKSLDNINLTLEWNWMETKGKYQRQYFRLNKSQSHTHSLPIDELPIYSTGVAGISGEAGVEISSDRSWGMYEKITANTLTYLHVVYNGLVRRQGGKKDWKKYRDAHKGEIIRLIKKVGDEVSTPRKEAVENKIKPDVLKACKRHKLYPHEVDEDTIIDTFEKYLKQVEEATKVEGDRNWVPKEEEKERKRIQRRNKVLIKRKKALNLPAGHPKQPLAPLYFDED